MRVIDIALKDLLRSFRSAFIIVMMFVAPLLVTGLIYLAFGSMGGGGGFSLPTPRVQVANLDRPGAGASVQGGQLLASYLQTEMASLLKTTVAPGEASARSAVDSKAADVAVIIPETFTGALYSPGVSATVQLYYDPAMSLGPAIVKSVVSSFVDAFAGAKIAVDVAEQQMAERGLEADHAASAQLAGQYALWAQASTGGKPGSSPVMTVRSPASAVPQPQEQQGNQFSAAATIMAGMLIFFLFFTAANSATSIIREDEEGTLARLFTTPTPQGVILGGKLTGVAVILVVQAIVLAVASALLFGVNWGEPLGIVAVMLALVVVAAGFGVFLASFAKTTRQAGPLQGGVLATMAMLGGLFMPIQNVPGAVEVATLSMPQGWAMRGLKLLQAGGSFADVWVPVVVMLAMGAIFFMIGLRIFRRRFA